MLAWQLSNTLDGYFCLDALQQALDTGTPTIFHTDQGAQFTASAFTHSLASAGIRISMDGRGRTLDNIFIERLWRTVKYEDSYLKEYASVPEYDQSSRLGRVPINDGHTPVVRTASAARRR